MHIAMLGTGSVGRTLGAALVAVGHRVAMGSRTADNPTAAGWAETTGEGATHGTFADAAAGAELVVNATGGMASLSALASCDPQHLDGTVVMDVANPLDFSAGFPPSLAVANTDSLAEQIQAAHPTARVVKAFNTMAVEVMVDPTSVAGDHVLLMAGDDPAAKEVVTDLAVDLGWNPGQVVDLGALDAARGMEMWLPLWLRLYGLAGHPRFNLAIATAPEGTARSA